MAPVLAIVVLSTIVWIFSIVGSTPLEIRSAGLD